MRLRRARPDRPPSCWRGSWKCHSSRSSSCGRTSAAAAGGGCGLAHGQIGTRRSRRAWASRAATRSPRSARSSSRTSRAETRFTPPPLLADHGVVSGLTVVIGSPQAPYGVLGRTRDGSGASSPRTTSTSSRPWPTSSPRPANDSSDEERLERARRGRKVARGAAQGRHREHRRRGRGVRRARVGAPLQPRRGRAAWPAVCSDGLAGIMRAFEWPTGRDRRRARRPARASSCACARRTTRTGSMDGAVGVPDPGRRGRGAGAGGTILVLRDVTAARNARNVRDAFLGVLSHELRTPVTTIYGGSEMLARKSAARCPRRDGARSTRTFAPRPIGCIGWSRTCSCSVARRAAGADRSKRSRCCCSGCMPRVIESRRRAGRRRRGTRELPPDLPPVAAEETYIEQVLRNLLGNAAKYGGDGPVTVTRQGHRQDRRRQRLRRRPGLPGR